MQNETKFTSAESGGSIYTELFHNWYIQLQIQIWIQINIRVMDLIVNKLAIHSGHQW